MMVRLLAWYTKKRRGSRTQWCHCCSRFTNSFLCLECEEAFANLDKAELSRYVRSKRPGATDV